jgi:hypothetical protein
VFLKSVGYVSMVVSFNNTVPIYDINNQTVTLASLTYTVGPYLSTASEGER